VKALSMVRSATVVARRYLVVRQSSGRHHRKSTSRRICR
jgi:hypothetical protein